MEDMVLSVDIPLFMRVLSWWLLVQSWGTLRFDDHRGLLPRDFKISETGLLAKLSRSKVSGPEKRLNFRVVVIHSSAYVQHKNWLSIGWELLQKGAPHERDYLLPSPSNNFRGFKTKELKYATAFAVQSHVIFLASYRGLRIFQGSTGHWYTPHSDFMPSGAAVLGFSKADRDILGGRSAAGSERYTRTAKFKIAQMQSAIAASFRDPDSDQLVEAGDIDDLSDLLRTWKFEKSILCEGVGVVKRVHTLFGGVQRLATALKEVEEVREEVQEIRDEWEDEEVKENGRTQGRREALITCVDEMTCATPLSHAVQCDS